MRRKANKKLYFNSSIDEEILKVVRGENLKQKKHVDRYKKCEIKEMFKESGY